MMLKLKQVLQGHIVLLLLGSIVLGSIPFSLITCQGINLINQVIIVPRQEREARQNVAGIMRGQAAYSLAESRFSNSMKELGVGVGTDTENYSYRIHRGIQITLNDYLFLPSEKTTIKSLKIPEDQIYTPPKKLPKISSDIVMISAQPKKAGLKTYIGFILPCDTSANHGTPDCPDDAPYLMILYESEQPLTPPPSTMKVSLPLAFCDTGECNRKQIPTPEGFRSVSARH